MRVFWFALITSLMILSACTPPDPSDQVLRKPKKKNKHLPPLGITAYVEPVKADALWVRPGWKNEEIGEFQEARFICLNPVNGTLYVSQPYHGWIAACKLKNGRYEKVANFVTGVQGIHGLCWKDGWLWFGRAGSITKARCTNGTNVANQIVPVIPDKGIIYKGHASRSIFVDDHGFYTGIGDPLNASEPDEDRERMWYYTLDGRHRKLFVSGIRNVEKLQFRPGTHEIWGMDHGSDAYGQAYGEKVGTRQPITDEMPREKFLHFQAGAFYGHPYFVQGRFPRTEYAKRKDLLKLAARVPVPDMLYGAHWAPDGWCFYTGDQIPDAKGDAFMAFHGSWNRSHKEGYRIERTLFDKVTGKPYGHYMLVHTLGAAEKVLGRPVDVIQAPDGSLLWSDDWRHCVNRLSYVGAK